MCLADVLTKMKPNYHPNPKADEWSIPHCHKCGELLRLQIDPINNEISKHLYGCDCEPDNKLISIG